MRLGFSLAASVLALVLLVSAPGCTAPTGRIPIKGTVRYKGEPLAKGVITFIPTEQAKGSTEGALIADGQYALAADKGLLPGSYHVSISSVQARSAADPAAAPGAPKGARELIPERYNAKSKLTIDVVAGGKQDFDFPLD